MHTVIMRFEYPGYTCFRAYIFNGDEAQGFSFDATGEIGDTRATFTAKDACLLISWGLEKDGASIIVDTRPQQEASHQ